MADCSRAPHRNNRGLAKNLSGVFGFGSKGVYDDVFVSRPKMRAPAFTPGAKDYAEIFNCKQPSSIPVLELDEFEFRSSEVDYGNVFGGFGQDQIGSSYEEVFHVGDGVGRTDVSHAQSRGSDHSTAVEGSQKQTHESLHRKKRSMSFDKITRVGKREADEITGQAKIFELPVSTTTLGGTVPLKSAEVRRSGALTNNLKQRYEEAPVEKLSRKVSSGGLSKHDADGLVEINLRSRNGYGSDKSISCDKAMDTNIIRCKVQISEAVIASDSIPNSGRPIATSKDQAGSKSGAYRSNASEDPYVGFSSSAVKVQTLHAQDKPFIRDSAMYEVAEHNAPHSKMIFSSGLTQDHGGACATPAQQTGNPDARNSNASENTKDVTFSYSKDVKFQDVNGMRKSLTNFPVDATAARPKAANSTSSSVTHSQHNSVKLNTASKGDLVRDTTASRNADSKSTDWGSNEHLTDSVKFKKEAGLDELIASDIPMNTKVINLEAHNSKVLPPSTSGTQGNLNHGVPALKKTTTSKSGEFRRSTNARVRDDHSPSSSDDEIDKNSEAAISAAAVKKAIREAQVWISIAKESNGVKGFMNHGVTKNFRQVKEGKEAINLEVKEKPKFFELGQTTIENNSRMNATRKDYVAQWAAHSVEEVNSKETELCASDRLHQMEDAVIQSSSRKTIETASTIQRVTRSISTSEEKLTIYCGKPEEKLVHSKKDARMPEEKLPNQNFGLARLVQKAKCSEVLSAEKRETDMSLTYDREALFNKYDEANTVTKISNAKESQEPMSKNDKGFMVQSFHDDFGQCDVGHSVNSFEVKEDIISGKAHMAVHTNKPNAGIKAESEGLRTPCSDNSKEGLASTSLEEENEAESELDPHDQVSDCEDTDLQDYASAEENLVSTDTDDEISDKDLNLPAQNQFDNVEDDIPMENMVEATIISEDVSAPSFNTLNVEQIVKETDESEAVPLQNKVTHETKVTSDEKTVPFSNYSNEDPVDEETDERVDMRLQNMVKHEVKVTPEERTTTVFNYSDEDSMVDETDVIGDVPVVNIVAPKAKITCEDGVAPKAKITCEDGVAPCIDSTNEDPRVEETGGIEDVAEQNVVIPQANIIPEDDMVPFFDSSNEDIMVEEIIADKTEAGTASSPNHEHEKAVDDMTEQNMVIPKTSIMSEDDLDPCFDNSSEILMVEEILAETSEKSGVGSPIHEHEKGAAESARFFILEHTSLDKEELESVARAEAESASIVDHASSQSEGSVVEVGRTDNVSVGSVEDTIKESRSTPWNCEHKNQEAGVATSSDLEPRTQAREELHNIAMVESDFIEKVFETESIRGSENDQVDIDAPRQEDANELESTMLHPDHVNHELKAGSGLCDLEPRTQAREELHNVATAESDFIGKGCETESIRGSENDQVNIDALRHEDANKLESTLLHSDHVNHELKAGSGLCDLEPRTQAQEDLHNVATAESDFIEKGFETESIRGSENDQVDIDAPRHEDANELESTLLPPDHVNHELKAGSGFFEPLPEFSQNEETTDFEQHSENLTQSMERPERKKWEIPREAFELPELKSGISEVHDTMEQDSGQVKRQTDKHERKKWEILRETFAISVLGDEVVEEIEESEQDRERVTQSAEKPERKKWKIQKEVFAVPILFAEAAQETSEQEGFVIKTASDEEMRMRDDCSNNLKFSNESVQHGELQNEFSTDEEQVVPDEGVFPGIRDDNSQDHMEKEWTPEIKMLEEEEREKQFNETADQQETKVEEGKAFGKGESKKGLEDINVKDEIKRTLGMLWKKIYKSKQEEDLESVKSEAKEEDALRDEKGRGVEKDLNLTGPVELVESPRQHDVIEAVNFPDQSIGNEDKEEETSCPNQFEVNGIETFDSGEFISTKEVTEELRRYSSSSSDSCKLQEDDSRTCAEETCKQYYNANDVESHSEEILSSLGFENSTETEQIHGHGADKSVKEGSPEKNIPPSDVNECSQIDSEILSGLEPLLPDESFVADAEDTEKVKNLFQDNRSKEDEMLETTSTNAACQDTDDEVESLLADDISDKSSERHDTSSTRQDSKSVSDSEVADDTSSREFEQEDKNEIEPDMVEQATSWNWVFGEELSDRSIKQNETPDVRLLHKEKAKTKEAADEINTSLDTGKAKTNDDKPSRMEARAPEGMQKEVSPDQEVLNNIMREKARERIVVERTIREVRERAFAEARERAAMERANAEAKQKAIADDQERSQKKSLEAKLAAEKSSLDAKRKAELERAAVERATAEARQRALEKAMSRKEQASQGSSSRSTNTSNHGSSSKDRLNDDKPSESALRFKARNERHQRIAERAAKALAEKNMRDLLVQREQAERNRLSEVLDADVKRWASGKTSNLRALLSTLQYILGPDSGWQPIHLTEIVTADAVKKAYRKATLFVHPDKLQQRGATIKQKYICEKVFDLLKEARNRFDRDER